MTIANPLRPGFAYVELGLHQAALGRIGALESAIRELEGRIVDDGIIVDDADWNNLKRLVPPA